MTRRLKPPEGQPTGGGLEWLTRREMDVLALIAQGYDNTAIARELHLGVKSVENYVNHIFGSLGLFELQGRQSRVLAALGYHYGLEQIAALGPITRFAKANRVLVAARLQYLEAHADYVQACAEVEDTVGATITPRQLIEISQRDSR